MNDNEEIVMGNGRKNNLISQAQQNNPIPQEYIDSEFVIPTEIISLASKGIYYIKGQNQVKIKYMTADAEDILYSPELINSGKVLDVILKEGIVDSNNLDPDDMLSGDRNQLLLELRKTGLGDDYKPGKMKCPSCKEEHAPTINLNDFTIKSASEDCDEKGWHEVILPVTKKNIKFRFMTGHDEKAISKSKKTIPGKSKIKYDKLVTERYLRQIMEIDGITDKIYIKKFIGIMPLKDSAFLREYIKRIEPGLNTMVTLECDKCGHVYEHDIVLNPIKLFYPDAEIDE